VISATGALRLSAAFRRLGLGHGDRIAFLDGQLRRIRVLRVSPWPASVLTRVPLAVLLGAEDHVYMTNFARCRALVYHARLTSARACR
jgi:hypothetical protein